MPNSLYLVAPKSQMPHVFGAEVFAHWGLSSAQFIADAGLSTVAACAPPDFEIRICDGSISPIDWETPAELIGITGKITQVGGMILAAQEFRRRGKTVLIGGPYASLCPEVVRPHCDLLVRGEMEEVAPQLFADLRAGCAKDEYVGGRPDLSMSPLPRWDLYKNDRALIGAVQTSRGCPFECDFCDVIPYLGRKQRHKSIAQVLAELDQLAQYGYSEVFFADDNFTANRRRAKELLAALAEWNQHNAHGSIRFCTQLSIDAAQDDELLRLCAAAGVEVVYIGIETPNEQALKESNKRQNLVQDLSERIRRFLDHGITVWSGSIVGFDADGLDIFERYYEFAMASPIPIFTLGSLVAPAATPLYTRMKNENRLIPLENETIAVPWATNIIPRQMTNEQLRAGLHWLANRLYCPAAFGERLLRMIEQLEPQPSAVRPRQSLPQRAGILRDRGMVLKRFLQSGPEESKMAKRIAWALLQKPQVAGRAIGAMLQYAQLRCMYDLGGFWDPQLARQAAPVL